jgi:hypothetical protein
LALSYYAKVITKSSANRTRVAPHARFHVILESPVQHGVQKDIREQRRDNTALRVPSVAKRKSPSSRIPAFNHLSIIRRIAPSITQDISQLLTFVIK